MNEVDEFLEVMDTFNRLDTSIPVDALISLIEIANADLKGSHLSVAGLSECRSISYHVALRHAHYWAEKGRQAKGGGFKFVKVAKDECDGRRRVLMLTPKGRSFLGGLPHGYQMR